MAEEKANELFEPGHPWRCPCCWSTNVEVTQRGNGISQWSCRECEFMYCEKSTKDED